MNRKNEIIQKMTDYADALFAKEAIINPAVQKIKIDCPSWIDEAEVKSALPDAPSFGFSVYQKNDTLWASYLPYGEEDDNGVVFFSGKIIVFMPPYSCRAVFFEKCQTQHLLQKASSVQIVGKDFHDYLHFSAVHFKQCLLEICDKFYPMNFSEEAMEYYANIAREESKIQKVTVRLWVFSRFSTRTYYWLLFNDDDQQGYQTYGGPQKFLDKINLDYLPGFAHNAYPPNEILNFENKIQDMQAIIDSEFEKIKHFAIHHPYQKNDRWNLMLAPYETQMLPFTKFSNPCNTLQLNWGDIPHGAVGNAFACFYGLYAKREKSFLKIIAFPSQPFKK